MPHGPGAATDDRSHRLVIAYHACDRTLGEQVLLGKEKLAPSNNSWDWLGHGIYFWEHGLARAWDWGRESAARVKPKPTIKEPFVIGAYIYLGRCFDLTDTWATTLLGEHYQTMTALLAQQQRTMPQNKAAGAADADFTKRYLDCAVINFTLQNLARQEPTLAYQTVRGVFVEGNEIYPGARVYNKTHVQLAIRDPTCVLGCFLPQSQQ